MESLLVSAQKRRARQESAKFSVPFISAAPASLFTIWSSCASSVWFRNRKSAATTRLVGEVKIGVLRHYVKLG